MELVVVIMLTFLLYYKLVTFVVVNETQLFPFSNRTHLKSSIVMCYNINKLTYLRQLINIAEVLTTQFVLLSS